MTTVVYMPKKTLAVLLERAIAEGLAPATPALLVFHATRPNQQVVEGTARDLAARVEAAGSKAPPSSWWARPLRRLGAEAAVAAIEPDKLAI